MGIFNISVFGRKSNYAVENLYSSRCNLSRTFVQTARIPGIVIHYRYCREGLLANSSYYRTAHRIWSAGVTSVSKKVSKASFSGKSVL
ncbi:hypothetical protein Y032_0048g1695 [Ancylostoma ceylanicum]|uniref:Uncharacterized protein n=1 Tax=Ancylostoma ceylanicum TaxID=53326 RepID=A0A016UBP3_9BILA|nr:hypothetical protein Y032_0048g1695 [Ancylostoma ceylanicum]